MELQDGEVGSAIRTEGADKETGGLKPPSMSDSPVVTEQPPDPELLELREEGDAGSGESGTLDEFAKQFHHWLRLFMMVLFVVLGDRIRAQAAQVS